MSKEDDLLDEYVLSTDYIADGDPVRCVTSHTTTAASSSPPPPSMRDELVLLVGSQGGIVSRIALPTSPDSTTAAAAAATVGDANAETAAVVEIQPGGPNTIHPHQISAILSSSSLSFASSSLLPPLFTTNNNSTDITSSSMYITGCKDGKIRIMNGHTHELLTTLEGHTNAVTSLSWIESSSNNNNNMDVTNNEAHAPWLVSGSWDGTARIYPYMFMYIRWT
jgi:WD40 repeat protein